MEIVSASKKSIILPSQKTMGWPKKAKELPVDDLHKILTTPWREDVHFCQYAVIDEIGPYRYNNEIFASPEFEEYRKQGGAIEQIAVAFDIDSPAKKEGSAGAVDIWFESEREKISRLLRTFPGGMVWRTKGGWRGCWYHHRRLTSTDDTALWRKDYLAAIVFLEREFGIVADSACNDWNRLHRVPWGIRATDVGFGWQEPETRETIGRLEGSFELAAVASDIDRTEARRRFVSSWKKPTLSKNKTARADDYNTRAIYTGPSVWFKILERRGMLLGDLGGGKQGVRCPNEAQHTTAGNTTSTVLYSPGVGEVLGHVYCSHSHCQGQDWRQLLGVTGEEWGSALREALSEAPPPSEATTIADTPTKTEETHDEAERRVVSSLIPDPNQGHKLAAIAANVTRLLTEHPYWMDALAYDSFKHERYWKRIPDFLQSAHKFDKRVLESDFAAVQGWLYRGNGLDQRPPMSVSLEATRVGIFDACAVNTFDSLREHVLGFNGIWDGTQRLDTWCSAYLGTDDTVLSRAIGKRWLIASIARALQPGCVADMMPILEGKQEVGKNYLLDILYTSEFVSIPFGAKVGDKDFDQKAADSWCVHDDELACTQRAGLEQVKSWLTQKTAKFRKAFDRDFTTVARRFIIVGSTNRDSYLTDEENRRFWPLRVVQLRSQELMRDREQLWSEALAYYTTGCDWRITKQDILWDALENEHMQRKDTDPVADKVLRVLESGAVRAPFTISMLLDVMGFSYENNNRVVGIVSMALKKLGYSNRRVRRSGPSGKSINAHFWDKNHEQDPVLTLLNTSEQAWNGLSKPSDRN